MRGKVTFNNILLRLHVEKEVERKTANGIILPSGIEEEDKKKMKIYKEHPFQGDVIQVGDMVKVCKPGDRVYINGGLQDLVEDGVYYSIIREHDVVYVITKEEWEKEQLKESIKQPIPPIQIN